MAQSSKYFVIKSYEYIRTTVFSHVIPLLCCKINMKLIQQNIGNFQKLSQFASGTNYQNNELS